MSSNSKKYIPFQCIDNRFRTNYKHYLFQSVLIFICISFILLLSRFFDAIVVASLGASSFILFTTPHKDGSRPRYVIGGYVCGLISGILFHFLYNGITGLRFVGTEYVSLFVCAMAVAVTAFFMVATNLEHPPAAALALGLSVDVNCYKSAVAAVISVVILCFVKQTLKKHLRDL